MICIENSSGEELERVNIVCWSDGAFRSSTEESAWGVVLRDTSGHVILYAWKKLDVADSAEAEAQGLSAVVEIYAFLRKKKRSLESLLFERMVSLKHLFLCWKQFRRGKRKRKDIQIFEI